MWGMVGETLRDDATGKMAKVCFMIESKFINSYINLYPFFFSLDSIYLLIVA